MKPLGFVAVAMAMSGCAGADPTLKVWTTEKDTVVQWELRNDYRSTIYVPVSYSIGGEEGRLPACVLLNDSLMLLIGVPRERPESVMSEVRGVLRVRQLNPGEMLSGKLHVARPFKVTGQIGFSQGEPYAFVLGPAATVRQVRMVVEYWLGIPNNDEYEILVENERVATSWLGDGGLRDIGIARALLNGKANIVPRLSSEAVSRMCWAQSARTDIPVLRPNPVGDMAPGPAERVGN